LTKNREKIKAWLLEHFYLSSILSWPCKIAVSGQNTGKNPGFSPDFRRWLLTMWYDEAEFLWKKPPTQPTELSINSFLLIVIRNFSLAA